MTAPDPTELPVQRDYEGGIPLTRGGQQNGYRDAGHVFVHHYEGEPTVAFHLTVSGIGGSGSAYQELTADEANEIAGALKMAAEKAKASERVVA